MLQTIFSVIVAVGMSTTAFANQETSFEPFTGKVIGSKVRMRTQPSIDSHVVRELNNGELFAVTGKQEGFYAVQPPEHTKGYVFRTFVLDGVVEGSHVNVRLYPDIEAPAIAQLNTGDRVQTRVCDINNKWLEVELPNSAKFYIAEEYCERIGGAELLAQVRNRQVEARHKLSAACLYAQAEIQKALPQIDLDGITTRFRQIINEYKDLPEVVAHAEESDHLISEVYIQKKLAFLEHKSGQNLAATELNPHHIERLAQLGIQVRSSTAQIAEAASETMGCVATLHTSAVTDKMLMWEPIEQALHHLWSATHSGDLNSFYEEQQKDAVALTGMVEAYNRPVKNLPGDYLLRIDNHPVAFLYSTHVNLDKLIGRQVTIVGSPRPNNHFAFPAYFVLSAE